MEEQIARLEKSMKELVDHMQAQIDFYRENYDEAVAILKNSGYSTCKWCGKLTEGNTYCSLDCAEANESDSTEQRVTNN